MARSPRTPPYQNAGTVVPDDVSKLIIEQLQQDGRRSYAAIGKAVGLSEAAVRQRVQRLVDGGVMQIVAVTDPLMLGFHRQTMIGIKCSGDLGQVADHLAGMPEIDYVVITSGSFDLLAEVVCEDDDHLLEILSRVRRAPSVPSTEPSPGGASRRVRSWASQSRGARTGAPRVARTTTARRRAARPAPVDRRTRGRQRGAAAGGLRPDGRAGRATRTARPPQQ